MGERIKDEFLCEFFSYFNHVEKKSKAGGL